MSLFVQIADFKKIAQYEFENFCSSFIDFDRQEWQFIQLTNPENDVEISYLFQFDIVENQEYIEIFHNGLGKDNIQYNILNVITGEFPTFNYYFD